MNPRTFHLALLVVALSLTTFLDPAVAQESDTTASEGFTRRHIDAQARRSSRILLRDWPELSGLLAWTRQLESAVVDDEETLSAELLEAFRARVDTLATQPIPRFLASRGDSVKAVFASIRTRLEEAESALEAIPAEVRSAEGEAANAPDRKRTLVTGKTAVTVPSGVAVGDRDTLPKAVIEGEDPVNYVDLVALALADLDRLVHLVRKVKVEVDPVNGSPSPAERAPSDRTAPPPRER